mgnify:CR=1 FL=1
MTDTVHTSDHAPIDPGVEAMVGDHADLPDPPDPEAAQAAFRSDVAELRTSPGGGAIGERILLILSGIVSPLGLLFIILGWRGASTTPNDFEQIPYLISGGLLGLGLVFLGGFFYFAHWMTTLVKEHRQQSADLLAALRQMHHEAMAHAGDGFGDAANGHRANGRHAAGDEWSVADLDGHQTWSGPTDLVATARGSMAHRRDCAVVAGKPGLRPVEDPADWAACKLCEPFELA